jgi:hypothetical protein
MSIFSNRKEVDISTLLRMLYASKGLILHLEGI